MKPKLCQECKEKPATSFFHRKEVCGKCYERLNHPKKRGVTMDQLLKLQKKIEREYELKKEEYEFKMKDFERRKRTLK